MEVSLKGKKTNSRNVFIGVITITLSVFLFIAATKSFGIYKCLKDHYPNDFARVTVYENKEDHSPEPSVLDKGKAIYNRRYAYGNTIYKTKISQKEFDDEFYVCRYKPSKLYSETDLHNRGEDLIFSGVLVVLSIGSTIAGCTILFNKDKNRVNKNHYE